MAFTTKRCATIVGFILTLIASTGAIGASPVTITMPEGPTAAPSRVPGAKTSRPQAPPTPKPVALPANLTIPRYAQGPEPFRDGETLVYAATWEGIPAADARVVVVHNRAHPDWWTGQMWISSSKVVDKLYRMRDYFREDFDFGSWRPDAVAILQHEKSRQDRWQASFNSDRTLITAVRTNKQNRTWIRRFTGGAPWGPFSGAMIALSQPLNVGQKYTFDVFSGGNRYVFAFKVLDREQLTIGLGTFKVLKIEPSVVWLSEGSFRDQASAMLIWVTDDSKHLPIRIESAVFIGSVRADLTHASQLPAPVAAKPNSPTGSRPPSAPSPSLPRS